MIDWDSLPVQTRVRTDVASVESRKFTYDEMLAQVWRGGAILIQMGNSSQVTTVDCCYFKACLNTEMDPYYFEQIGGGAICVLTGRLVCRMCYFEACQARLGSGGAILAEVDVTLDDCNFTRCGTKRSNQGGRSFGGALYAATGSVALTKCFFYQCHTEEELSCAGAVFCVDLEASFCQFTTCTAAERAGAVLVGMNSTYDGKRLILTDCMFVECSGKKSCGGAIGVESTSNFDLVMERCKVCDCTANTGGSCLYSVSNGVNNISDCTFGGCRTIKGDTCHRGTLVFRGYEDDTLHFVVQFRNCTQKDNQYNISVSKKMSSIYIHYEMKDTEQNVNALNCYFSECTFYQESCGSAVAIVSNMNGSALTHCTFARCTFQNLNMCGIEVNTCNRLSIIDSTFTSCGGCIVNLAIQTSEIIFDNVSFSKCQSTAPTLLNIRRETSSVDLRASSQSSVNISRCVFDECKCTGASSESEPGGLLFVDSDYVSFCDSSLYQCSSASGRLLSVSCKLVDLTGNEISDSGSSSSRTSSAVHVTLTEGATLFENTIFQTTVTSGVPVHPLLEIQCGQYASVAFYNCCFTHSVASEPFTGDHPLFLKAVVSGNMSFSDVCFDAAKDTSVSFDSSSGGHVEFQGHENEFFVYCQCFGPWISPSQTPETKTGDGRLGGMIAGIVVCVLIVLILGIIGVVRFYGSKQRMNHGLSTQYQDPLYTNPESSPWRDGPVSRDIADECQAAIFREDFAESIT